MKYFIMFLGFIAFVILLFGIPAKFITFAILVWFILFILWVAVVSISFDLHEMATKDKL